MELHRFFRYAIEKMCKEKKSLNHFDVSFKVFTNVRDKKQNKQKKVIQKWSILSEYK